MIHVVDSILLGLRIQNCSALVPVPWVTKQKAKCKQMVKGKILIEFLVDKVSQREDTKIQQSWLVNQTCHTGTKLIRDNILERW